MVDCRVYFRDALGVEHSAEVRAESLYEAVCRGWAAFMFAGGWDLFEASLSWLPPIHGPIAWTRISFSNGYQRTATAPTGRSTSAGFWMDWQIDQRMPAPRLRAE